MATWEQEYERRLRRVAGVTDDSLAVRVEVEAEREWSGGCETCGWYTETSFVNVYVGAGYNVVTRTFTGETAVAELMRALAEVEDE
jgi:hypothetical protein